MEKLTNKPQLIDAIQTSRRQLDRTLFFFEKDLSGETPQLPAPGFTWKEMDQLNEQIFEHHRLRSLTEVLEWFRTSYQQIHQAINTIPEEDLFTPGRYTWQGKHSLLEYALANTANHYRWANSKIRTWQKQAT